MSDEALRTPAHIEEFADLVAALRTKALDPALRDKPVDPAAEARAGRTSAGLRLMYTARRDGTGPEAVFVHHLSASMVGSVGGQPDPAPGPFVLLALKLLRGLPHADGMFLSPNGVYHAEWVIPADGEAAYAAAPPPILHVQQLAATLQRYDACAAGAFRAPGP